MKDIFLNQDDLIKEVEEWKYFTNGLGSQKDRESFKTILNDYCNYLSILINAKNQFFPSEALVVALILSQYKKMINWLMDKISEYNKHSRNVELSKGQDCSHHCFLV
jgi:hypothetical protein